MLLLIIAFVIGILAALVPMYNIYYFTKDGMSFSNATSNTLFVINMIILTSIIFLDFYLANSIFYYISRGKLRESYPEICGSDQNCSKSVIRKCASTRGCLL